MADPETIIDHFKIWQVERRESPWKSFLSLEDQFTARWETRRVPGRPRVDCKSGRKEWQQAILHKEPHLTGYRMKFAAGEFRRRRQELCSVYNQFTSKEGVRWHLGPPQYLLVPAG